MAIGVQSVAPDNSLIVAGKVGIDVASPRNALEVNGSVVVGSDSVFAPEDAFYSYKPFNIAEVSPASESFFVNGDTFIEQGYFQLFSGADSVLIYPENKNLDDAG